MNVATGFRSLAILSAALAVGCENNVLLSDQDMGMAGGPTCGRELEDARPGNRYSCDLGAAPDALAATPDQMALCSDRLRNNGESDVDCGGTCPPCGEGRGCSWAGDCAGRACIDGRCDVGRIATVVVVGPCMISAAVADVTWDGRRDIVLGCGSGYQVLSAVPGPGFKILPSVWFAQQAGGNYVYLVDVNRDGRADLLSGGWTDPFVYVLPGLGGGKFESAWSYRVTANDQPGWGRSLAPGDFDGDGDVDVAVGDAEEGLVLLRNRGNGTFGVETFRQYAGEVGAGDFDKDGVVDVVLEVGPLVKRMSKLIPCNQRTGGDVLVGDFNGDGWLDMGSRLEICFGDGKGGLLPPRRVEGALVPQGARNSESWTGDLNGDGRADLIAHSITRPPLAEQEILEVALGAADGRLRYSWSLAFDAGLVRAGVGRPVSESRDDLLVGIGAFPDLARKPELRILTFK